MARSDIRRHNLRYAKQECHQRALACACITDPIFWLIRRINDSFFIKNCNMISAVSTSRFNLVLKTYWYCSRWCCIYGISTSYLVPIQVKLLLWRKILSTTDPITQTGGQVTSSNCSSRQQVSFFVSHSFASGVWCLSSSYLHTLPAQWPCN